ncbi:cellulose synthase subunit BcsC-related outer membrane protein [Vibrio ponticus]|uniref:cellulose synthase subunit BcsC-related outer membrane protein n=1 Tax=Vibrio ponticus TaxID=265668 RepID=UPI0009FAD8D7|nr:cellulose synthase subunit BcsC-related outer membrane protein [Vibrio ponticus]
MSVSGRASWLVSLCCIAGGVGGAQAANFSSKPLSKEQLLGVYQPIEPTQFSTSAARVNSVAWLVEQLKLADAIGRDDIVESTLERLFAIDETSPIGLFYQANMFLKRQQLALAQQTFERLKQSAPNSSQTQDLAEIIAIRTDKKLDYQRAKLLAKSGRYQEAIEAYKTLFPTGMPSAALQLEFLQLQGNLTQNWQMVKQGLEQLNAEYPGVPQFQLALANHIRKQDPADAWILDTYNKLALVPSVGKSAATSWLRALDQLPISAQVVQQYAILASYYPADLEIQRANQSAIQRWNTEQALRKDPTYLAKLKGLQLLEQGKTEQAAVQLRYALTTRPDDPEILGGMGKVYLRRGEQQRALAYFQRAQALDKDPDSASKWATLVETSRYWSYLDQGDALMAQGKYPQAERFYRRAIQLDSSQPYAFTGLGASLVSQAQYLAADKAYRQALQLEPLNGSALRGRLDTRIVQNDWLGAQSIANHYSSKQKLVVSEKIKAIESEIILVNLRQAIDKNDAVMTREASDQLIALNPSSPWQRLDIANVIQSLGEKKRADRLMADWNQSSQDPEMKFAYALYLAQEYRLLEATQQLESIDTNDRTPAMQRNLTRLKLDVELRDVQSRYLVDPQSVTDSLDMLSAQYAGQVQPLARIVAAWIAIERTDKANKIYTSLFPLQSWSFDDQLAYGEMMVSLQRFADFDHWFKQQTSQAEYASLSVSQVLQFEELNIRRLLAQGDVLLATHQPQQALEVFQQVSTKSEPFVTQAQIGMLQASALIDEHAIYHDLHLLLLKKKSSLTAAQLMTVAEVFNQQGYREDANTLNQALDNTPDANAFAYRNSLAIAMDNQQWNLAERRVYQALDSDRLEKNPQLTETDQSSLTLRELYDSAADYWLTRNVKADIDALRDRSDGHVMFGWDYSARDGNNTTNQVPIEARIPVEEWDGHLLLRADYVAVDSGKLEYFEKDPDHSPKDNVVEGSASGVALGIGWQAQDWQVDIGTTPVGFDHTTWVGGVGVNGDLGEFGWSVDASRRPETSSTLSYSGLSVPAQTSELSGEGTKWGGVVSTGLKLNSSWDIGGPYGFWSSLQYHSLTGENVADNTRLGLLGGGYYKLIATDTQRLSIGTNLIYLSYDKNLGEYSLYHGGYYSPQSYISLSLPVNFYGRYDSTWSYLLSGSISNSWTQQDGPYLVENGKSERGGGFGASLQAAVEKRVSKHWYLGALVDLQRSEFYTPNHFMLYAKYTFNDRWQPIAYPPQPPILYSDF